MSHGFSNILANALEIDIMVVYTLSLQEFLISLVNNDLIKLRYILVGIKVVGYYQRGISNDDKSS